MQEASFLLRDEWKINWKKVQVCSCCLWTLVIFKGLMTQSLLMVSLVFSFLVQLWDGACPESAWKGDLVSPDKTCLCGNTTSVRVLIAHLSLQLPKTLKCVNFNQQALQCYFFTVLLVTQYHTEKTPDTQIWTQKQSLSRVFPFTLAIAWVLWAPLYFGSILPVSFQGTEN